MTEQADQWGSEFGEEYTRRNPNTPDEMQELYVARFGMDRTTMNDAFLGDLPRDIRVLEVGCNVGMQLNLLARAGFTNLHGIEINPFAVERAREANRGLPIDFQVGSALELPFDDGTFDLVYTSGVLIHIHPDDLATVQREMSRCSRRWIWGFEYFTEEGYVEIPYRGQRNLLWKTDFARRFLENVEGWELVCEERFTYLDESGGLQDQMYLLEKRDR